MAREVCCAVQLMSLAVGPMPFVVFFSDFLFPWFPHFSPDEEQDRLIRAAQVRARDEQIAQNREHQAVRNRRLQKVNQQQLQETLRRLGVEVTAPFAWNYFEFSFLRKITRVFGDFQGTSPAHRGYTLGDGSTK